MLSIINISCSDSDPFRLFDQMGVADASHAFYLGYEMMKARTALTLSKSYRQDQALEWGFLTVPEVSHVAPAERRPASRPCRRSPRTEAPPLQDGGHRGFRRGPRVILEGIVTTLSPEDVLNVAPMGPEIDPELNMERFVLRPYRTSTTYANLKARGEGVLHVTDDVLLLAQTAIGTVGRAAAGHAAGRRRRRGDLAWTPADIMSSGSSSSTTMRIERGSSSRPSPRAGIRDFFGFNRAKHAVVEAAILATRTAWLPLEGLLLEFRKLEVLVQKTGGPSEQAAFQLFYEHLREAAARRGLDPDSRPAPP